MILKRVSGVLKDQAAQCGKAFCIICTANESSGIFPPDELSESKVQVGEMRSCDHKSSIETSPNTNQCGSASPKRNSGASDPFIRV